MVYLDDIPTTDIKKDDLLNILVCSVKLFPGVFSGSALLSSAETCRLDLQPPALHTPCWDSEVEGGG